MFRKPSRKRPFVAPVGSTAVSGAVAMVNLIGTPADPAAIVAVPGAHLHLYGKAPKPGRKVGHVTVVGDTPTQLAPRLARIESLVTSS